jgi:hypothetical protein
MTTEFVITEFHFLIPQKEKLNEKHVTINNFMLYSSMWRVLLKATSYTSNTNTACLSYSKKFVGSYLHTPWSKLITVRFTLITFSLKVIIVWLKLITVWSKLITFCLKLITVQSKLILFEMILIHPTSHTMNIFVWHSFHKEEKERGESFFYISIIFSFSFARKTMRSLSL